MATRMIFVDSMDREEKTALLGALGYMARVDGVLSPEEVSFIRGMAATLELCRLAEKQGRLDFVFEGISSVDDRPALLFKRRLPYTGEDGFWPNALLEMHVDRDLLVPTLCSTYADEAGHVLLGRYLTTDIRLNADLPESVFTKKGMDL